MPLKRENIFFKKDLNSFHFPHELITIYFFLLSLLPSFQYIIPKLNLVTFIAILVLIVFLYAFIPMNPWIITILCSEFLAFSYIMLHVSCNCFFISVLFVRVIYQCVIHGETYNFFFLILPMDMLLISKCSLSQNTIMSILVQVIVWEVVEGSASQSFSLCLQAFINRTVQRREPIWLGGGVSQPTCNPLRHVP